MSRSKRNRKDTRKVKHNKKNKARRHSKDSANSKNEKNNSDLSKSRKATVAKLRVLCRRYEEFHDHFLTYDKIVEFLQKTQKENPGHVEVFDIGKSGQGKPIYLALITSDSQINPKQVTFIEAGLNGQDAFAVSNAIYMIDFLSKNSSYSKIMDYFIVPCANPDAYDTYIKSKSCCTKPKKEPDPCALTKSKSSSNCVRAKKPRRQSPAQNKEEAKQDDVATSENEKTFKMVQKPDPYKSSSNAPSRGASSHCGINNGNKSCTEKTRKNQNSNFHMDLSQNFPVVLGLSDMRDIPSNTFLEKIKLWKENYVYAAPETQALLRTVNQYQFAIKLLISLQEGGEAICYPYGFCSRTGPDAVTLIEVAKKARSAICGRNFEYGTIYDLKGLTYGSLVDFLKMDKGSIKHTYLIQVHKKSGKYNEENELKQLLYYGCQIMECVKTMATAVYKSNTVMTGNKVVETVCPRPKRGIDKKSTFF